MNECTVGWMDRQLDRPTNGTDGITKRTDG